MLTCVTGVSGSGKSTLVHDVIYAALKRAKGDWDKPVGAHETFEGAEYVTDVVLVDQQPIGRIAALESGHVSQGVRSRSGSCSRPPRTRGRAV